eukprot:scaffold251735_cov15-Tisochrysis_lutea.AAC.1
MSGRWGRLAPLCLLYGCHALLMAPPARRHARPVATAAQPATPPLDDDGQPLLRKFELCHLDANGEID